MENKDKPAFPGLNKDGYATGITKYEYFLAHAPETIPEWFRNSMEEFGERPKVRKMAGANVDVDLTAQDEWDQRNKTERYFQWRQFWAITMCAL